MHSVRPATVADLPFLFDMLYEAAAVAWTLRGENPPARDDLIAHPSNARYLAGWMRPSDSGVIAEDPDGSSVGAAWYRLFAAGERGDGIVAEPNVPEIAIAVAEASRGRGVGEALLRALIDEARASGFSRLALSVDPQNPARRLYARCGFRLLPPGNPHAGTSLLMICDTSDGPG